MDGSDATRAKWRRYCSATVQRAAAVLWINALFFDRIAVHMLRAECSTVKGCLFLATIAFAGCYYIVLLGPVVYERTASSLDFNPTCSLCPLPPDKGFLPYWALYSPPTSRQQNNNSDPALLLRQPVTLRTYSSSKNNVRVYGVGRWGCVPWCLI